VYRNIHVVGLDEAADEITPIGRVRYVQLERGTACLTGALAQTGHLIVARCGADRNRMVQIDTVPGRATLFVPVRGYARLGTTTLGTDSAVLVRRGAPLTAFLDKNLIALTVSVSSQHLYEVAASHHIDLQLSPEEISVVRCSPARISVADRLAESVLQRRPDGLPQLAATERAATLEEALLRYCMTLLGFAVPRSQTQDSTSRLRAVLRAREFIDAHLDQPISLMQICRVSYASPRALEYGFREAFALSPMAYVRCARLSRVRHELHLAEPRPRTVTRLAMKWGFWHLGQFSRDYRAFFGELPSETLARSSARVGFTGGACAKLIAASPSGQ
jgi:AraC family ethanolamine operon transcriptional activator